MTMRRFNRAILIRDAFVVSRWRHPVVVAQVIVQPRQITIAVPTEVTVGRTQTIRAVLLWGSSTSNQCIL